MGKSRTHVVCDRSVPQEEQLWIVRAIRKCARLWDCELYEYHVSVVKLAARAGQMHVRLVRGARVVIIELDKASLAEKRDVMRTTLVHELLHVLDDVAWQALDDLASHIKDGPTRRRALRRARQKYETLHDQHAKLWSRIIYKEPRRRSIG